MSRTTYYVGTDGRMQRVVLSVKDDYPKAKADAEYFGAQVAGRIIYIWTGKGDDERLIAMGRNGEVYRLPGMEAA